MEMEMGFETILLEHMCDNSLLVGYLDSHHPGLKHQRKSGTQPTSDIHRYQRRGLKKVLSSMS